MKDKHESSKHKGKHKYTFSKHKSRGGSTRRHSRRSICGVRTLEEHIYELVLADLKDFEQSLENLDPQRHINIFKLFLGIVSKAIDTFPCTKAILLISTALNLIKLFAPD